MKLVKIKVRNFRCYHQETEFYLNDLTAIIGKNDIGKSAILDAIDAFFNDSIDQGDVSTNVDENKVEITAYFENFPAEIVLDTSVPSSPLDEGILNELNQLEIKKVFTFGGRKSTAIFLVAHYLEDARLVDLLRMKNTRLKQYAEGELGIDLTGVNTRKNPPIRQKIRDHVGGGRAIREIKVDGNVDSEDNLKEIWGSLKKMLPVFALFRADKTFDDKDGDIKNPLHTAIKEALALAEIQTLLEQVQVKVKEFSTDVADRTIEKLKNIDASISEKLKSEFTKDPSYDKVFDITLLNEKNIPLNKRGSGIRRLVVLSFFQAQAERRKSEKDAPSIIYAIEEPETSQHPNHQKMIINALSDLSEQDDVQVLFTTHSANLVREIPIDALRYVSPDEAGNIKIEYGKDAATDQNNEAVIQKIIEALGILPNPADKIKVLVFVEGNNDVNALKVYSEIIHGNNNAYINLNEVDFVGYVITGGSSLKHYIEKRYLDGLGKPQVHIYDSDVPEYVRLVAQINNEKNPRKIAFNTNKRELENYLHADAVIEAYGENGLNRLQLRPIDDEMDVPAVVAEALYAHSGADWVALNPEKQRELADKKKKALNTQAVQKMNAHRLRDRDGFDEVCGWLLQINNLAGNGYEFLGRNSGDIIPD